MNTNSIRREVLISAGGFVVGGLTMGFVLTLWPQRPLGVEVTHAVAGVNYVAVPKPAEVSFQTEFGLRSMELGRLEQTSPRKRAYHELDRSDMPRQKPWVAPYEFLLHPDQRR